MIHLNKILFPAAIVCALTSGIHIFMGGAEIIQPFLDLNFELALKLTLLAVWHMVSAVLIICFVYFNESLFLQLPQWILLLPIGVLTLWGGLRKA